MAELKLINKVPAEEKVIAFTFDDGPDPLYTRQLLDIFRRINGKATFFMIGRQMELFGEVAAEVYAAGHEIANHTFTHPDLTKLTLEEARTELELAGEQIKRVTGTFPSHFRPPYFAVNSDLLRLAAESGYLNVGCVNGEARDWEQPGVEYIVNQTRLTIGNGSICLFHDGYGERAQTVEAVQMLTEELTAEGYRFVTVSELLKAADAGCSG